MSAQFVIYHILRNNVTHKCTGFGNYRGTIYAFWGNVDRGFMFKKHDTIESAKRSFNKVYRKNVFRTVRFTRRSKRQFYKTLTTNIGQYEKSNNIQEHEI